jgi:aryl-alcohol dehydrogenase-like predicted oxidoreductase
VSVPTLVRLPGTAIEVSRLCLGGNRFGAGLDREASFEVLDVFHEAGGNFIDTAHVYADWLPGIERSSSEKTIGRWLAARGLRGKTVVATKGGHPELGDPASRRLDRASLREDATRSRDNLGTEDIPIFYLHRDDPGRPVDEILGALEELRGDGVIRHYAASNWTLPRLVEAGRIARRTGWQGFVANQPEWSLARRNPGSAAADLVAMDDETFAWHRETGTALIPYSAQARGYFDKVAGGSIDPATAAAYDNLPNRTLAARLSEIAATLGASPTQVMLAMMVAAPFVVVPVVGCRTREQVISCFGSLELDVAAVTTA